MFELIYARTRGVDRSVLGPLIELALEIAREGREGRHVGTIFTVGDAEAVIQRSRPLILDPLLGHPADAKRITDRNLRGTLKELAQLDGAFVISDEGVAVSACRYLDAAVEEVDLPLGLGSRHLAAASISRLTRAAAVVVSESGTVRIFHGGKLVAEIMPELWNLSRRNVQLKGPRVTEEQVKDLTVLVQED